MRTPFGVIDTEDRPRTQALADHEQRQLRRLGASLERLSNAMRSARTVRDAVDIEIQLEKELATHEASQGAREFTADEQRNGPDDFPYTTVDEMAAFHLSQGPADDDAGGTGAESADRTLPAIALYGFAAWLTGRDEAVTFSAHDDAAPAVDLVERFCDSQGYTTDMPEDWTERLRPYPAASAVPPTTDAEKADEADADVTFDMLLLSGVTGRVDSLALLRAHVHAWTPAQRREAERYAAAVHLSAADNDVVIPDEPQFLADVIGELKARDHLSTHPSAVADETQQNRQGNEPPAAGAPPT